MAHAPFGTAPSAWRLYVIVDRAAIGDRDIVDVADAAIRGGADVLQLRDKTASARQLIEEAARLHPLTSAARIPLIINDRPDVARFIGAEGVHIGQDDVPIDAVRLMIESSGFIGKSTHSLPQALAAQAEGADYIGLGPIFATPTKPEYGSVGPELIHQVVPHLRIPIVCIGGLDGRTVERALTAGARCVAVVRAVCAANDPEAATRQLKHTITQFVPLTARS